MKRRLAAWAARSSAAERLWRGSSTVARRRVTALADWVGRGRRDDLTGWRAAVGPLLRLALLAAAAYAVWAVVRALPWLLWLLTGWWVAVAWRAGRTSADGRSEAEPAPAPGGSREAVVELLADLIGDRPGVHLSALLAHLQERGHGEGWKVADLRARLETLGVPVRRSVKVARKVAYGVHREDLPERSPAAPAEPAA
ncbi:hypothetical protein [Streptomyces tremellae]|uniref:Uncharacterized protein n=1 Tax=Streptomyces tremellae TaxID=1124239 RepID=A0ABP7EEI1_9ACTN